MNTQWPRIWYTFNGEFSILNPMKPHSKSLYNGLTAVILLYAVAALSSVSMAEEMSMDAFQIKFKQETGKSWADATAEEKRNFVSAVNPSKVRQNSVADTPSGDTTGQMASIAVRTQFQRENNKDWGKATLEEQKAFLERYKATQMKAKQEEAQKRRKKEALLRKKEMQRQRDLRNIEKQKRDKESRRRKDERELQKKREAARKNLEKVKKNMEKMRTGLQRKHH